MKDEFSIDLSWLPSAHGPWEVSGTAASMEIKVGQKVATRIEDSWSRSVQTRTRVSAYPIALWIASSWWRLRWEPFPLTGTPGIDWRMAHDLPAAGFGYLWPPLRFASDGDHILVTSTPSNPLSDDPVRYLDGFSESVPAGAFEKAIDSFVSLVLARLDAVHPETTQLHRLWEEILEERKSPESTRQRRIEAMLGYEPDDAPDEIISRLEVLSGRSGEAAIDEITPVCAGPNHSAILDQIESLASSAGIDALPPAVKLPLQNWPPSAPPWVIGQHLARTYRSTCGLNGQPISDSRLAEILGVTVPTIQEASAGTGKQPLGLAVRQRGTQTLQLHFRKRNRPALRFEAARFIVDQHLAPDAEVWLPATDTSTSRQKIQRAFAAEFLCPIESLRQFLDGDHSMQSLEDAADEFGIAEIAIKGILANHGDIPADWVAP